MLTIGKRCVALAFMGLTCLGSPYAYGDCDGSILVGGVWRPTSDPDGIYAWGDVYCAQFTFLDGRWGVVIQTSGGSGGWASVHLGHDSGGVDLWSVTVSAGPSGATKALVDLVYEDFNDVECVQIDGSSLTRLWLHGRITGDLDQLDVTDIGNIPAGVSAFSVGGDMRGTVNLREVSGVSDLDQVPGFVIQGDLTGDVLARGGGIGRLVVLGTA